MSVFDETRAQFHLPDGLVYLDGNSLGPLPLAAKARMAARMGDEWGHLLIAGWNKAGWLDDSVRLGERIGRLIGAEKGSVIVGDTLSIRIYQALAAAIAMRPERRVILSDSGNFPSDLYMASGLIETLRQGHSLRLVAPDEVAAAIDDTIAVVMLTEVDYRSGRKHDMKALTQKTHDSGALTVWDLAHSAGAIEVDLESAGADFAAGCTYKYLNAGPGAPAFVYVSPRHLDAAKPALSGWLGHAAPFAFETGYSPAKGIERMRIGTPPVLAFAALEAALDVFELVSMTEVRVQSRLLSDMFVHEVERRCPELELMSPRDSNMRGSQVSFAHEEGYAIMQALIANKVVGDFRAPNLIRFGFAPLYNSESDVVRAAGVLETVMRQKLWDKAEYRQKAAVT